MSERGFYWLTRGYKVSLGWVLRHRRLILAVAVLMVFVNVFLYINVPKGFFPQQDTGRLSGNDHGRPGRLLRRHERQDQRVHRTS